MSDLERIAKLEVKMDLLTEVVQAHMDKEEEDRKELLRRLDTIERKMVMDRSYLAGIGTGLLTLWFILSEVGPWLVSAIKRLV